MIFGQHRLLTTLLLVGVIASAYVLAIRHSVETRNRVVEIAVDYNEVAAVAGASGKTVPKVLKELKAAGATSLAVQELTGADLVNSAIATVVRQGDLTAFEGVPPGSVIPVSRNTSAAIKGGPEYALTLPFGFPSVAIDAAGKAGMPVVARLVNYPGVDKAELDRVAARLRRMRVQTVIFAADQVLGFRGAVDEAAGAFKEHGLNFGSVEFSKQKGDEKMSRKMLPDVVRVHSITAAEMGSLDRATAVQRFVKAAKERNIRLLYVRMFDISDPDPLKTNADYVRQIAYELRKEGLGIAPARPFATPVVSAPALALIGVGVAAGLMLLVLSVVTLPLGTQKWVTGVFVVVFAALSASGITIALKLVALASAIIFPTLAVLYAASWSADARSTSRFHAFFWPAVQRFVGAVAVSMAGGLMIAALLTKLSFMLHIDQFSGVKLATVAPLLFLALAFAGVVGWKPDTWEAQKERMLENIRRIAAEPVLIWQTALAFALLVMVGLLVMRSGNEPGVGVSPLELKFRSLLDTILLVRPRTKEFLVGHPAMILGIMAALGGRRNWAAVLLVIGAFGEVSLLNTMCHIHTPVGISIMRGVIGALVGFLITLVLIAAASRGDTRRSRPRNVRRRTGVGKSRL